MSIKPATQVPAASDLLSLLSAVEPELKQVVAAFEAEVRSDLPCVNQLVQHVERFRGKMLRPVLLLLAGKACGHLTPAHITLGAVVEMVHMATLVHDDVLDEAEVRRKGATLNHLRGNEAAVLLGDYLISHSYHLCSSLAGQGAARLIGATTNAVCEGELLQINNRNNLDLDEPTYYEIIKRKTAMLVSTSCRLGAEYAGATPEQVEAMAEYGLRLGIAFQIQDDVLDLLGEETTVGKTLGIDVEKQKLTLPLIHFLRTAPAEHRSLLRALLRGQDGERAEKVRDLILPSGSLDFARQAAQGEVAKALACLQMLPRSPWRDALETAGAFVVVRGV